MSFEAKNQRALVLEQMVCAELMSRWKCLGELNRGGENYSHDITLFRPVHVEVKGDDMSKETGNLYFETHNCHRDKQSGLTATKAEHWAHFAPGETTLFLYPPKHMLAWLLSMKLKQMSGCGDKNSVGYTVPIKRIRELDWVEKMPFFGNA